jgi:hypothetical protein
MASTFAGNFTLVGSVANLIVAQRRRARRAARLLELFQNRRAAHGRYDRARRLVALRESAVRGCEHHRMIGPALI